MLDLLNCWWQISTPGATLFWFVASIRISGRLIIIQQRRVHETVHNVHATLTSSSVSWAQRNTSPFPEEFDNSNWSSSVLRERVNAWKKLLVRPQLQKQSCVIKNYWIVFERQESASFMCFEMVSGSPFLESSWWYQQCNAGTTTTGQWDTTTEPTMNPWIKCYKVMPLG